MRLFVPKTCGYKTLVPETCLSDHVISNDEDLGVSLDPESLNPGNLGCEEANILRSATNNNLVSQRVVIWGKIF